MNQSPSSLGSDLMISFKYAFAIAEEYVMYDDQNRIAIDKDLLIEDGVSKDNIQIITKWKKHHNQIQKAMNSGDQEKIDKALDRLENGKFQHITNPVNWTSEDNDNTARSHVPTNYWPWALTACGITYGQSSHTEPPVTVSYQLYTSKTAMANTLVADRYSKLTSGFGGGDADLVAAERDYGRINTTGHGGCTGGEFRDQQVITHDNIGYNQNFYVGGQTYKGIGATGQFNEPNSNLNEYVAPTWWWDVYVWQWHESN